MTSRTTKRVALLFAVSSVLMIAFQNCGQFVAEQSFDQQSKVSGASVGFQKIQQEILNSKCLSCHATSPRDFSNFESLMASGIVLPFQPENSSLFTQFENGKAHQGTLALSEDEVQMLATWIEAGALDDSSLSGTPLAPTDLVSTVTPNRAALLAWSDNSNDETYFQIERSTSFPNSFTVIARIGANFRTYADATIAPGATYFYRISAVNAAGTSQPSNLATVATPIDSGTPPPSGGGGGTPPIVPTLNAPTGLFATPTSNSIILQWLDNSSTETGFRIERSNNINGPFTAIATTASNIAQFTNAGLSVGATYYYRVAALNGSTLSIYSNVVGGTVTQTSTTPTTTSTTTTTTPMSTTTTLPKTAPPAGPTGLFVTPTSNSMILQWTDNSSDETSFRIERSSSNTGPFVMIAAGAANTIRFTDPGLAPGATYYYRVAAVNGGGNSVYSNVAGGKTTVLTANSPTDLVATAVSKSQINLTWTDASTNETGFVLERSTSASGPFAELVVLGAGITSYSDTNLSQNTAYHYRVRARNSYGDSLPTRTASATTLNY